VIDDEQELRDRVADLEEQLSEAREELRELLETEDE
jgi:hypothetical protein